MHSLVAALVTVALVVGASSAGAATFTVNSTADTTDGTCGVAIGDCTLHEAMDAAVATAGRDTIAFDPTVFPPGAPAVIAIFQVLPVIADAAGTVLDGAGASVVLEPANLQGAAADPLVFASAAGVALTNVTVANVTVRGFTGSGVVICGGEFPTCDQDVAKAVVRNVVASGNGDAGIRIKGRAVTKARIADSVASANAGTGIDVDASQSLVGTRVERCTARDNGSTGFGEPGISLHAATQNAATVLTDSIAVHNGTMGIAISGDGRTIKTKLTHVTSIANMSYGISVFSNGDAIGNTIADTYAADNMADGIIFDAGTTLSGTTVKNVVTRANGGRGMQLGASFHLIGGKISDTQAVGNGHEGIVVFTGVDASGVRVTRTVVAANAGIGLQMLGSRHVVKGVRADGNGAGIQLDPPGGGNTIEKCTAHANNGPPSGVGIAVTSGSTGNVIRKNAAFLNDGFDMTDGNTNCDGNAWTQNLFSGVQDPCIQ